MSGLVLALRVLHYAMPLAVVVYVAIFSIITTCSRPPQPQAPTVQANRRKLGLSRLLTLTVTLLYAAEGFLYAMRALVQRGWWAESDAVCYVMGSVLVWGVVYIVLDEADAPNWPVYYGIWAVDTLLEAPVCPLAIVATAQADGFDNCRLGIQAARLFCLVQLCGLALFMPNAAASAEDEESEPLLAENERDPQYGAVARRSEEEGQDPHKELRDQQRKHIEAKGGWLGYLSEFLIFVPYVVPKKDRRMQLYIAIIMLIIAGDRAMNVLVPRQLGIIVDRLSETYNTGRLPWAAFAVYLALSVVRDRITSPVKAILEVRLTYWSYVQLTTFAFRHVMGLSLDYHESKDSGDLLKGVQQANSLNEIVDLVFINTCPVIFDIFIGIGYVTYLFDAYFAWILIVVGVSYFVVTFKFTRWNAQRRRVYVERSRNQNKKLYEAMSNWQTIAYFNRTRFEEERFAHVTESETEAMTSYYDHSQLMYQSQGLVMLLGYMSMALLGAYRVSQGVRPVGSFVTLTAYWGTISMPLRTLGSSYKRLTKNLIDAERLLQLVQRTSKVVEAPGARPLRVCSGRVQFSDVRFAYDERKETLKGIDFVAEPGQTVALVGETGSGKSTTVKLLFRFYDVASGGVVIDGQNVRDVTVDSLREAIGVVPQDPSLFNTSILENVRYARLEATDEEVYEACRAASIHDKILGFPDGYLTKVGERGVKLSGGELQRVSIARIFLKNPRMVVLDEATSAIDSSTETQIQNSFRKLSAGRTTFVIAHRLSTVMDANLILVMDDGAVAERGTHDELLALNGKYRELWTKQSPEQQKTASGGSSTAAGDDEAAASSPDSSKGDSHHTSDRVDGASSSKDAGSSQSDEQDNGQAKAEGKQPAADQSRETSSTESYHTPQNSPADSRDSKK